MRVSGWKAWSITAGAIIGIAVFLSASAAPPRPQALQAPAQELVFSLDQSQSKVHYHVDSALHAVHGTFNLKSGILRIDPATGKAAGEIIVYATSGDSGNSSRDEKMHKVVLESSKYSEIVFKPALLDGKLASSGASDVKLHGVFSLHGTDHDLVVPVHAEISGDHWKGSTRFLVPYIQWGLKDPSNFLLKVKPNVDVELELAGSLKSVHP
ncbi:MAG TPA: YceI family protein [Candidatus Acidoferrum sp.]|jgi:polyisoprenoid-binding protein YceI